MRDDIQERLERYNDLLEDDDIPAETKAEVKAMVEPAVNELHRRRQPAAFARFVSGYLSQEFQRKSRGEREDPLCACDDELCPIKQGILPNYCYPRESRHLGADEDAEDLIRDLMLSHPELAVSEAESLWVSRGADADRRLNHGVSRLRQAKHADLEAQFTQGL